MIVEHVAGQYLAGHRGEGRRDVGSAAGGDDDGVGLDAPAAALGIGNIEFVFAGEARAADEGGDLEAVHVVDVAVAYAGHHFFLMMPGLVHVGVQFATDAALGEVAAGSDQASGVVPGLFRHAAAVQATTAPVGTLDDGDVQAAQGGERGGAVAAGAGADDGEVEMVIHAGSLAWLFVPVDGFQIRG